MDKVTGIALMGQAVYGLIDNGLWGVRIVAGIVTGIRYTEDKPVYEISFGKSSYWTQTVTQDVAEIPTLMGVAPLERIAETHGLKIKYEH